jgi:DNA-binding CsgD family transcriptional regulator
MSVILLRNGETVMNEAEVVWMLSVGLNKPQISEKLGIKIRTLESKIDQIRAYYGALNTAHLVALFLRKGLIE